MRKIFFIFIWCIWGVTFGARAETVTLTDGSSLSGDILKFDDNGLMLHTTSDTYTNVSWGRFSQDSLKQLSQNPKIAPLVEPFIEPTAATRPAKPEIKINPVNRLERPAKPSVILGMLTAPVGLVVLFIVWLANLWAAYEISVVKARSPGQVIGLAAIFPVIAPVIFLWKPMYVKPPVEEMPMEVVTAPGGVGEKPAEPVAVVETTWKPEEKKVEPQIFPRGKFTFNKRFVETKFAGYIGELKGEALKFSMEVRTSKGQFVVERILQVNPTDVIFETPNGQITAILTEIQEIKLNPKDA